MKTAGLAVLRVQAGSAGHAPVAAAHTGPDSFAPLLARHPRLAAIITHMGAPDYVDFVRLAEDHEHAKLLAEGLAQIPGVEIDPADVETNIVIFGVPDAGRVGAALIERGLELAAVDGRRLRAVTFLGVKRAGIDEAIGLIAEAVRAA